MALLQLASLPQNHITVILTILTIHFPTRITPQSSPGESGYTSTTAPPEVLQPDVLINKTGASKVATEECRNFCSYSLSILASEYEYLQSHRIYCHLDHQLPSPENDNPCFAKCRNECKSVCEIDDVLTDYYVNCPEDIKIDVTPPVVTPPKLAEPVVAVIVFFAILGSPILVLIVLWTWCSVTNWKLQRKFDRQQNRGADVTISPSAAQTFLRTAYVPSSPY